MIRAAEWVGMATASDADAAPSQVTLETQPGTKRVDHACPPMETARTPPHNDLTVGAMREEVGVVLLAHCLTG